MVFLNRKFTNRREHLTLTVVALLFALMFVLVLVAVGVLLLLSPGKPNPFLDNNGRSLAGSISEKIKIQINGVDQGMIIKAKNIRNPVLLYLHGGMPDYFLTQRYPTGLDDDFVVVWWEQRGSGLSFDANSPLALVNSEQLMLDTVAVTNYLRMRFGQEKIYLMGHSGGTFIGIQTAARAPDLYHAYIGVAQMSNQFESEKLAYAYMLQRFKVEGNPKMARQLEESPIGNAPPLPDLYLKVRDVAMHKLGIGTMHDMTSLVTGLLVATLLNREYTLDEKINLWRSKIVAGDRLWNTQLSTDLTKKVTQLDIPIYFFHGVYDYTVSYPLAKSYFELMVAPIKGFYTFTNSAHSPLFEAQERMREIMRADVQTGTKNLADSQ